MIGKCYISFIQISGNVKNWNMLVNPGSSQKRIPLIHILEGQLCGTGSPEAGEVHMGVFPSLEKFPLAHPSLGLYIYESCLLIVNCSSFLPQIVIGI